MFLGFPERFEIVRTLGEGGMGVVYEAFDRSRGETVALKTIRRAEPDALYRLKREFRSLANLEHPNLVRLYDLFVEAERCFFTMELVEGTDLASYVSGQMIGDAQDTLDGVEPVPVDEAALRHVLAGLLRGLEALHDAGLLHRDLKPSNVLVTPQGRVVLLDFGLVADAHAALQQTRAGAISGTVPYMAPEQARGEMELTTAVDLYAVGVILYQLLAGRLPFEGPALRILVSKQTEDPAPPTRLAAGASAELGALAMDLLARDPLARPRLEEVLRRIGHVRPRAATQTSSSRSNVVPLVGRDAELAALEAIYRRSHAGRPTMALVRGRSGFGKSALIQAFARRVEKSDRAMVLAGGCYEWESIAFKGLDGVVDALSRVLSVAPPDELGRLLPPDLGDLGTLFPVLRRIKPIAAAYARRALGEFPAHRVRSQGFACLRELLRRLAETSPVIVVVDDVQWADEDTARGLADLVRGDAAPALFLLVGARPRDDAPVLRELFGKETPEEASGLQRRVIDLEPLGQAAMRELARRELGEAKESLVETVAREARGVPFAAGELVRFLREGEAESAASFEGAASIDSLVTRRASLLDPTARRLLAVVAVAGEPMASDLLLRAARIEEDDRAPIDALRVRHFIRTVRSGTSTLLHTAHDRIREAVSAELSPQARSEIHRALATTMEGLETPPHDQLARHYAAAGERALGRHYAIAAAEEARAAVAFRRAAELYTLALELSDESERLPLLAPCAEALAAAGRHLESAELWSEAGRRSPGAPGRELRRRAAESWLYAGRIDQGLELLDEVASELGVRIPSGRLAVVWEIVKARARLFFRGLGARLRPTSAIGAGELETLRTLGTIAQQYSPVDPFRGIVPNTRYLLAALDIGDVDELARALAFEAGIHSMRGGFARADAIATRIEALAADHGSRIARHSAALARAVRGIFSGRNREAGRVLDELMNELDGSAQIPIGDVSIARYLAGFRATTRAEVEPLERLLEAAVEREEQAGPYAELRLRVVILPNYYLRMGQPERARAIADEAFWRSATRREVTFRSSAEMQAARALLYEGDLVAAEARIRKARQRMIASGGWSLTVARGHQVLTEGCIALAAGKKEWAREALRLIGRAKDDYHRGFELALGAIAAMAAGDAAGARQALEALRALGAATGNEILEATACFGLGRLLPSHEGDSARSRYLSLIAGSGIVDPDLFFWAAMPIGERPPRTRRKRSAWESKAESEPAPAPEPASPPSCPA